MRKVDPEKHAARRRQIVAAAVLCFARKGFHRTSTAEICAEAGMSPGNLFHYFASKQAIIAAIVDQEGLETAAYFEEARQAEDLFGQVLGFMDLVAELAADPTYARLALDISAEAMRDEEVAARVARNDAALRGHLREILAAAAERGQIDGSLDLDGAATWIAALVDGIFARVAVDPAFRPTGEKPMLRLLLSRFLRSGGPG
ncbi:TetR/AcrR family transcriptional regulator [Chelatococcus sp. SYSU_G07232]|uniref:TetR/AcrR family transcriptional regulator n=1 Tax=Chelatococcus albus TaxID=3047466 RepID=A0ABT7AFB6_9HYPH|nr:TetR/AcrR family transcriptional regulator [Chelatococcus sp. SYSU_G07232]MDJ1158059.1 TetR/AcrR family transcriptional regulator [Chelatococcus sp. SYSU_G07232]